MAERPAPSFIFKSLERQAVSYILATTEQRVRWYKFQFRNNVQSGEYELLDVLDLSQVELYGDKATAKLAALSIGLKTWRYVKI